MLGRKQEINLQLTEIFDSSVLAFSLWFSHYLRSKVVPMFMPDAIEIPPFEQFFWVLAVVPLFTPIALEARGFYSNIHNKTPAQSLRQLFEGLVIIGMFVGACVVFFKWEVPSRAVVLFSVGLGACGLLLRESWQRDRLRRRLASGKGRERVIVAGQEQDIENFIARLTQEQRAEIDVVMKFDITARPVAELESALKDHSISRVLFAVRHVHFGRIEEAVQACETVGVEAWIAADFFETAIARPTFDVMGGKLMLVFHSTPQASWELLFKGALDRIGAAILLVLSSPA